MSIIQHSNLLQNTERGLYCPAGDFYVDPKRPVKRAVITHAHSDHARWGCEHYLSSTAGEHLVRMRLSPDAEFDFLRYGETITHHGVKVTLFPAGHILGSAQVRLEHNGRVAVVAGDYKLGPDSTCASWEPVPCDLFVTESTFALPVYRWRDQTEIFAEVNAWWKASAEEDKCCLLYGYAVGKSQRLLAGLDASIGPIYTHGAVEKGVAAYRASGVELPETIYVGEVERKADFRGAMVVAVPSAHGTPWMRRFGKVSAAMASGWMMVRGTRRRRAADRGFVLSDHVDWATTLKAIELCDPEQVWVHHGYSAILARYLQSIGRDAVALDQAERRDENEDDEIDQAEANA
ncbi:ligase-associated DNA damage response exonuclease [Rhodopirellula sp. MGV]|uniref:ligase-associated DNA damage response exonuclease n=1 Tax=Rhodopirellula sp. MGV TaxID=2023130 RepID=UPI000B9686C0|nr:ligase-associated DNA damage response exonuclease [Rhodopirellula sp. MGV]OYP35952.1 DNA ligase-associated DEXH box helicase [Rhodopirellula sp. MGV]PNY34872.1 DNA ligase-associated DEXH box helicase [Rhodopirellula baltica]